MDARWQVGLLGGLCVAPGSAAGAAGPPPRTGAGGPGPIVTHFRTQKAAELLAFLAYHLTQLHPRDALVDLLWPDCDPQIGRNRLSNAISSLRRLLEPSGVPRGSVLVTARDAVQLNATAVQTDVAGFEGALQAAARAVDRAARAHWLTRAAEGYRGALLAGYDTSWILGERERLAERYFQALAQLVAHLEQVGDLDHAREYAHRAVRVDPLREEAHRDLMRLYAAAGQPAAALRQYADLERLLRAELSAAPSPAVQEMARAIEAGTWQGDDPVRPARREVAGPASLPIDARPGQASNLPLPLTRFFGREEEIARLRAMLLMEGRRLVTLTGPGGSGKTRLALEVAARLGEAWRDAVWFVPLADLITPPPTPLAGYPRRRRGCGSAGRLPEPDGEAGTRRRIGEAIRDALCLPRSPGLEPLEQVVSALSRRPALLLLDNFEHLVNQGAPVVRVLLARVPALTCLVTSRQRLDLSGEREFFVPPLPVPDLSDTQEGLARCESAQLFVDRARAVYPAFQVRPSNAAAVATLCRRLDGIPLALELAAARARVLTPAQMLVHLKRRFDFLVSRQRDTEPRHRTLRVTLEWSYRLLADELQRFLARLAVFRGGWTLSAVEAVCEEPLALDYLIQLRECSLVLADESEPEMRYRLLEMVREYAGEQLGMEEHAALGRRHAEYYLARVERVEPKLRERDPVLLLEEWEREHDNLRAALEWCMAADDAETGLRLGASLAGFWFARGYLTEGRERLAELLTWTGASGVSAARARALHEAGVLALQQSDYAAARALLAEGLTLLRELDDTHGIVVSLIALGWVASEQDDPGGVAVLFEEGLALAQQVGDKLGIAECLEGLMWEALSRSNYDRAVALGEESLTLCRETGAKPNIAWSLLNLGHAVRLHGDPGAARALYEESLLIGRELSHKAIIAHSLNNLGRVARCQGDSGTSCQEAALSLFEELDDRRGVALSLEGLAGIAATQGQARRAARLFGASAGLRDAIHAPVPAPERPEYERDLAIARATLGEERFAAAWAEGRAMTLAQAVACASERPELQCALADEIHPARFTP